MTVQKAIQFIEQELSKTLIEYYAWFEEKPELLNFKPEVGWSIEEILEHVTLTNHFLLILIRKGKIKAKDHAIKVNLNEAVSTYEYNLEELDQIDKHKSFLWIRPEHMEPMGDKTISEIKSIMKEQINECKEILSEIPNGEGILYKTTMTVNNLGKIDVYQYIYFLCQHANRHITQMQAVREEFSRNKVD
ncbi:DinB family protein [Paenibacillus alba]|uniref:DinB family protein n=1 Tax=Paenibacillus alba TaxID=1197127 RepID=UPI0015658E40|nr:DinB family protein [Paenibacillus alba]NQX67566.1 DinB family protein [Paenibacillus alba]